MMSSACSCYIQKNWIVHDFFFIIILAIVHFIIDNNCSIIIALFSSIFFTMIIHSLAITVVAKVVRTLQQSFPHVYLLQSFHFLNSLYKHQQFWEIWDDSGRLSGMMVDCHNGWYAEILRDWDDFERLRGFDNRQTDGRQIDRHL